MQICIFNRDLCTCYHKTHKTGISGRKRGSNCSLKNCFANSCGASLSDDTSGRCSFCYGRAAAFLLPAPDPRSCRTDDLLASCYPSSIHIGVFFLFYLFLYIYLFFCIYLYLIFYIYLYIFIYRLVSTYPLYHKAYVSTHTIFAIQNFIFFSTLYNVSIPCQLLTSTQYSNR